MPYPEFIAPLTPCNLSVRRCPVPREQASKRILIMRLGSYGDVLMGTPLLGALRHALPDAHFTWMVEYNAREAIDANPYLDELIVWDGGFWKDMLSERWKKMFTKGRLLGVRWLFHALRLRGRLRRNRYDIFISFQPEEWPLLVNGTGAPVTVGVFDTFREHYKATTTSPHTARYKHAFNFPHLPAHRTDQYLLALGALGLPPAADKRMRMGFTAEDAAAAQDFLTCQGIGLEDAPIVMAPMTTWPARNWAARQWVELADALSAQGHKIVMVGSTQDEERSQIAALAAETRLPPVLALGTLSFRQMSALLARAAVVISGDTGPMHAAAAVGVPTVSLFGPTPVARFAPLAGRGIALMHPVPCGPCHQSVCDNEGTDYMRCMRLITVEEVIQAVGLCLTTAVA